MSTLSCRMAAPLVFLAAPQAEPLLGGGFADIFEKGGVVMYIIVGLSVVGLAFAFERLVALRRGVLVPKAWTGELREAVKSGDAAKVEQFLKEEKGPLARILSAGFAVRNMGRREMERVMEAVGAHELSRVKRPIGPLAVLATVEPLLGLLGTILGMISTFNLLQSTSAADRVATLAPGIGQALYTTAAGLCVAIPFVLLHHFLTGKAHRIAEDWSLVGTEFVADWDVEDAGRERAA
ncbi:MAG TPA: MotA/TolQ/ExbB proton channel family protein [Planctomycetes bacterium]|nr:MotA/TolQ/ExbB proton channel family protein [Planctomycetota bacterium]